MEKIEDFIINEPYQKTHEDERDISKASPHGYHKEDWTSSHLDGFKNRLRDHLREQQHRRCAYCRLRIHENEATAEIDHIVPKDKKPLWMYDTFNLCLSCKLCNTKKGHSKKIVENDNMTSVPQNSDAYLIVHPYLDQYSEHIELVDDMLYKGVSDKGKYTIELCGLNRYQLAEARAEQIIIHDSSRYVKLMLALVDDDHRILVDNIDKLIENIKKIIKEYRETLNQGTL